MKYGLLSINGPPIIEWYAGILLLCIVLLLMLIMWIEYQDRKERRNDWRTEEWQDFDEDGLYDYTWENKGRVSDTGEGNQCSSGVLDSD